MQHCGFAALNQPPETSSSSTKLQCASHSMPTSCQANTCSRQECSTRCGTHMRYCDQAPINLPQGKQDGPALNHLQAAAAASTSKPHNAGESSQHLETTRQGYHVTATNTPQVYTCWNMLVQNNRLRRLAGHQRQPPHDTGVRVAHTARQSKMIW